MKRLIVLSTSLLLVACGSNEGAEEGLQRQLSENPVGSSPAVMLRKDGAAGDAWLATVHGYPDNLTVCEQLIAPYNKDPNLSIMPGRYHCEQIAKK